MTPARRAALGFALAVLGALAARPGHLARAAPVPQQGFPPGRVDPVFLPALGPPVTAAPGGCGARIAIQNVGSAPTRALVIGWGDPGTCVPAACRPAAAVLCTGLVAPGRAWTVESGAFGTPLASAVVFGTTGAACDALAAWPELRGCQGYARLRAAWDSGDTVGGIDIGAAYGAPLAVDVTRDCTDPDDKSRRMTASYAGVSGTRFGGYDRVFDVATHAAVVVRGGSDGDSTLHVQNGGARCASVEVWFQARGACQLQRLCAVTSQLPPGGTLDQPLADCAPPGAVGTAWVVSSEPPAVAIDLAYGGTLASYTAIPADLRRSFEGPPVFTAGSDRLVAPLAWPDEPATATLHVQNLVARESAAVRVADLATGRALATAAICPRGAATLVLRSPLPSGTVGAAPALDGGLRVESLARYDARGHRIPPPNLSAILELRTADGNATAHELAPVARLAGEDGSPGGTSRVAQVLAVPVVSRAADDALGTSTRIAVAPLVREPVRGRYLLGLFDANGLVDVACRPIADAADVVDLAGYGVVGADFRGTALISAVAWVAVGGGLPIRPGLAATALQRPWHAATGPRGDSWRAVEATPLTVGVRHALAERGAECLAAARLDPPPAAPPPSLAWLPACLAAVGR